MIFMKGRAVKLDAIIAELGLFFDLEGLEKDPGFSQFVPTAYEEIGSGWRESFEPNFVKSFNGLMLRGDPEVSQVFLAAFPTEEVLQEFIRRASPGDLFFTHHPIDMRCGDPQGEWSPAAWVPIKPETIDALRQRKLSFFAVHAPLDYHPRLSTSNAMANVLHVEVDGSFARYGNGDAGLYGNILPLSHDALVEKLKTIFNVPYLDLAGPKHSKIERVAVIAGCGDVVEFMQGAQARGVQAYISGEIHCHINTEYGRMRFQQMMDYVNDTSMSLLGVSHAASEFLVMRNEMSEWFQHRFNLPSYCIAESHWWR
jgi:putative NIF3 family GTP cyclohydrolase 1 type 2